MGDLVETRNAYQESMLVGRIGLSPDRVLIIRSWPTIWEAFAIIGGLILFLYLLGYIVTIWYAKFERKVSTIIRIYYFTPAK